MGLDTAYSRRRYLQLALGLTATTTTLAMACRPFGDRSETASKDHPPVTLRDQRSATSIAVQRSDEAIKEKYPWLTVIHEGGGSSSAEAMAKLVVLAASDSLPDIIYAQGTQIQFYISHKIVISLTPYLNKDKSFDLSDFPKVALDMYSRDGQIYAIPYDHGPQMLWYNKNLFEKQGVPLPDAKWTFNDLLEAARRLTIEGEQWGLVTDGPSGGWSMASYLNPWGGFWVDDTETRTGITNPGSLAALQFWVDLWHKHRVAPIPGTTQGDLFNEGRTAMRFGGPWTYRDMVGRINFTAVIADWPLGPTGRRVSASMGSGYPISINSKHRDEAWLYESEFLGKDMNRSMLGQFVQTGLGTPVRFSLMKEFEKSSFAPPNAQIIAPAESYSVIGRPISPIKPDLDRAWSEEISKLRRNEVSVRSFATTVEEKILPVLAQNTGWNTTR